MGAKVVLETSGAPTSTTAGQTQFWFLATSSITVPQTNEALRQLPYRSPGVLSKLYVRIPVNSTSLNSTVVVRKNGVDTGLTVTITAGVAEVKEDVTNTVTVAAGDKLCYKTVSGGTGTMTIAIMSCVFQADNGAVTKYNSGPATASYTLDNVTRFGGMGGTVTPNTATENVVKLKTIKKGSYRNLGVYVSANTRTSPSVIRSRKNGVDGNITLTIPAGAAGIGMHEDFTNEDNVNPGDDYNWSYITGTGAGENLTIQSTSCDFIEPAEGCGMFLSSTTAGLVQATGITNYIPVSGNVFGAGTVEADRKIKAREAFTLQGLSVFVSPNTITAPSFLRLRINGAPANQVITIPASTATVIANNTAIDLVNPTDEIDYELVTGATGTSLTVRNISMTHSLLIRRSKSITLLNNIVQRLSKNLTVRNNILSRYSIAYAIRNNLLSRLSKQITIRNNIPVRVSKTITIQNNILERRGINITIRNNILRRFTKQITLRNNIFGEVLTRISKSLTLRNNILSRFSKSIILRNKILVLPLPEIQLTPSIKNLRPWKSKITKGYDQKSVQEQFALDEADMMDKAKRKRNNSNSNSNNKNKWASRL